VKNYDECLVSIDYLVAFPDSFEGMRQNFRGVTFDSRTGEIISLPLHKFFNLNQTEATQFHVLKDCTATIYEKLDGSMIHFFIHPVRNELLASTRRSAETVQAKCGLMLAHKFGLEEKIRASIADGWTPIFEYVSSNNQIVIEYTTSRLVYLISRNMSTGEYRFDNSFPDTASRFEFPFKDISAYLDKQEFEGYVCHLNNGQIVKAKTPWYLERHRCIDSMMRPKYKLFAAVYDGVIDDILPTAPDRYKAALEEIYREAQTDWLHGLQSIELLAKNCLVAMIVANSFERKDFAVYANTHYPQYFSGIMSVYEGDDEGLRKFLRKKLMEGYKQKYPNRLLSDFADFDS
jgi:T4 RnlA family RNA ligase